MAKNSVFREALDWTVHVVIAVVIGLLIVTFVGQRTIVHDVSMQPTLYEGDNIIVEKISHKLGWLKPGDIIVFYVPEENRQLIKRLIAIEGDTVEIKDGKVYVNGKQMKEDYIKGGYTSGGAEQYNKITIPPGYVYVLGDNRQNSKDSRMMGPIDIKLIRGRAVFRFYPFNKIGKL